MAIISNLRKLISKGEISFLVIEKHLIIWVLVGIFVPLSINILIIRLFIWTILLLILFSIIIVRKYKTSHLKLPNFDVWDLSIIGLITVLFISTLLGEELAVNWPHFSLYVVTLCLGIYIRKEWECKITIKSLIALSFFILFLQSIISIVQQVTFSQFGNPMSYFGSVQEDQLSDAFGVQISRVQGTLGHPNLVANWIIVAFPFVFISTMIRSDLFGKNTWILKRIAIFLAIIAMIFTLSRGNILFFISLVSLFGCIYLIYFSKKVSFLKLRLKRWIFILFLMFTALLFAIENQEKVKLLFYVVEQRIGETFGESANQSDSTTASFRMEMNKGAIQAFTKNPVIGYGFHNSQNIWSDVDAKIPWYWEHRPHNVYLVMAVEGGIIAIILFSIVTLLPIYRLIFKYKKRDPVRFAFLFSLMACTGFSQIYLTTISPQFAPLYLILLGASMGYMDQTDNLKNNKYKFETIRNNRTAFL